jgi:putative endonuclease
MARCADGSLYVGYTANLTLRERQHNEGTGAQYTAERRPVRIVYCEEHQTEQAARTRERQLKR